MAEAAKEKIIRYMEDTHAAEQGGLQSMKAMLDDNIITDSEVRGAITEHIQVTQTQAQRLQARIEVLGGKVNSGKSMVDSIIAMGSHFVNLFHDKEDKQTQDVIKAAALEQFEIGAYSALKAFAGAIGDHETELLADTIMGEEQLARERLERLIPQVSVLAVAKTSDVMANVS